MSLDLDLLHADVLTHAVTSLWLYLHLFNNILWCLTDMTRLVKCNISSATQFWMVLHETFTTGLIFVRQSKQGSQPYVLSTITHNPKYLDQFLIVLLETFTTGFVFVRQSKQGSQLCFDHNYISLM